jgi:hypothetical protein
MKAIDKANVYRLGPVVGDYALERDLAPVLQKEEPLNSISVERDKMHEERYMPSGLAPSPTMQWVLLGLVTFWTTAVLALPLLLFLLTKSLVSVFPPITAALPLSYMWYRIISYVFPKTKEDYEIEALKLKHGAKTRDEIKHLSGQI